MKIYVDEVPMNCNKCMFLQNRSRHLDVDDNCFLNKLHIGKFDIDDKCPLQAIVGENKTLKQ